MPRNPNKIDYSAGFPPFFSAFSSLEDPRCGGNTKHHFGEVIFMAFTCIFCGINSYEDMEDFCEANEIWFSKFLEIPNGIPSYNTFSRIFEAIPPDEFAQCILFHLESANCDLENRHIAIDGKCLKGSSNTQDKHIHSVSAWACDKGLTLGQTFVANKSNEIKAIPELLKKLNIQNTVVSIDAMGTQTEIADLIIERKADYLLAVKGNQKSLLDEINDHFNFALAQLNKKKLNPDNWSSFETKELSRGRDEIRKTLVCHNLEWMSKSIRNRWKELNCIILVYRHTNLEDGSQRSQASYYISSLKDVKVSKIEQYVRNHWNIENCCHWILDAIFREDSIQVSKRNAAKNLATARRIALNILKQSPEISKRKKPASISKKQFQAAINTTYRETCLGIVP